MEESKVISGRYSKVIEDLSVRNTFLITLVIGVIGIIFGIYAGSSAISLIIPVIVMAVYIGITSYAKSDLPMTIIGDSYYYQGFIFTLVALMASLFSLGINEKVDMNAMVASFGAALVTTIIGLVARLFINSFSIGAHQRRERLETEIERALTTFTGQLEVLTTQVVSSVNNVHASTQSTLQETLAEYDKMNKKIIEKQVKSSEEGHTVIEAAMNSLASKINNIEVRPDLISKPIQLSMMDILAVLNDTDEKYKSHLSKFDINANKLTNQMDNTGSQIDTFIKRLGDKISTSISSTNNTISAEINEISKGIVQSITTLDELKSKTNDAVDAQLSSLSKSIAEVVQQLNMVTTPVKEAAEHVIAGVQTINKGLGELDSNIQLTSENIGNLKDVKHNISDLLVSVKALNAEINEGVYINKAANSIVASASESTKESSLQLAQDISNIYGELNKQIERIREVK
jgi:seryl-tRNA synthetase